MHACMSVHALSVHIHVYVQVCTSILHMSSNIPCRYVHTYIHTPVCVLYMYACTPTHLHDGFHHCVILRIIFGQCIHLPGILKEVVQQRRVFLGLLVIRTAVNIRIGLRANWGAARPNT